MDEYLTCIHIVSFGNFDLQFTRTFSDDEDGVTVEVEDENEVDLTGQNSTSISDMFGDFMTTAMDTVKPMIVAISHYCEPAIELVSLPKIQWHETVLDWLPIQILEFIFSTDLKQIDLT